MFETLQEQVHEYLANLGHVEEFATAAFGVPMSKDAIKSMTKQEDWCDTLQKHYGNKADGGSAIPTSGKGGGGAGGLVG